MNTRKLTRIFENYIERFEFINRPDGMNENYKWYAVRRFQEIFDLDAPDFASMLKKACRATENLIDSSMQHPFSGLVAIAEKYGEAETLRGMFRGLYADDGGDLTARQAKIDAFLASCDKLLARHVPSSRLYRNDQRSAMAYLWFYDPDRYSLCKNTEARHLADIAEFYDDWGPYAAFKLDVYERFYQGLIEAMRQNSDLMAVHASRFEGHEAEMHPDTNLHILAFDMIYCVKTYSLGGNISSARKPSAEEKRLAQQRREKAEDLAKRLEAAEQAKALLR